MDAVALLVNGQQAGQSQKASGGRWARSSSPWLTVHGKDSPRERTVRGHQPSRGWDAAGHGDGHSLGLLTSSHQGCHGKGGYSLIHGHLAQDKAMAHGASFWR